jgi:hypothetical protein
MALNPVPSPINPAIHSLPYSRSAPESQQTIDPCLSPVSFKADRHLSLPETLLTSRFLAAKARPDPIN